MSTPNKQNRWQRKQKCTIIIIVEHINYITDCMLDSLCECAFHWIVGLWFVVCLLINMSDDVPWMLFSIIYFLITPSVIASNSMKYWMKCSQQFDDDDSNNNFFLSTISAQYVPNCVAKYTGDSVGNCINNILGWVNSNVYGFACISCLSVWIWLSIMSLEKMLNTTRALTNNDNEEDMSTTIALTTMNRHRRGFPVAE